MILQGSNTLRTYKSERELSREPKDNNKDSIPSHISHNHNLKIKTSIINIKIKDQFQAMKTKDQVLKIEIGNQTILIVIIDIP